MTDPSEQPEQPEPQSGEQPTNEQLWKLTIQAEAEVIPGDPEED